MSNKAIVLLGDEAPIMELDEIRPLIAEGQERGFLTFEQIAGCLEEADLTKEQVQRLWGLDPSTCEAILEALEQALFLKRTNANRYVRANGETDLQSRQS